MSEFILSDQFISECFSDMWTLYLTFTGILLSVFTLLYSFVANKKDELKVGSINSIFYFLHKAAEPFNCLEQDNLA